MRFAHRVGAAVMLIAVFSAACGNDQSSSQLGASSDVPIVVATTSILGDVLRNLADGQFEVVTVMPAGSDPHTFQPSAQDVATIVKARAIIANGASFEGGLLDAIEAAQASGTPVFEAITAVNAIEPNNDDDHDDHDEHADRDDHDEHADRDDHDEDADHDGDHDEHADHDDHDEDADHDDHDEDADHDGDHDEHAAHDEPDEHDHRKAGGLDPHFFTDPARMAVAADGIVEFLIAHVDAIDASELRADADRYIDVLNELDAQVESMLAEVPASRRVLVTNHAVFGYFADRYDFEIIGTVVPVGSGSEGSSGRRLVELAALLERESVSVVFTDTSSSDELARTLAGEVGEVAVIKLYTESLGDPGSDGATYVEMVRTNARDISQALAS